MSELTPEENFNERVQRLAKFVEIHAPKVIICAEVMLVFKAAFGCYKEFMRNAFGDWVNEVQLGEIATCPHCLKYMPHEQHICDNCLNKANEEF